MKKRVFLFMLSIALVISNAVMGANPGDTITLDLNDPLNPESFEFDPEKGQWTETFNDEDYSFIEFKPFAFSHLIAGEGAGMGGYYWDGFTVCSSGDNTNYGNGGSHGWVANQWGNTAGGGIKTDATGKVMKENGVVQVEKGIPYMTAYWGYFMESADMHCLQTIFNDGEMYKAIGMYVNNHPWPYYGNISGDGFARALDQEGDYFKLIIHGMDENYDYNGKSVEHMLAEFKNGQLVQSDKWEWIDLSSLGKVAGLYYTMETTDADPMWGPNTAVYFCMDKLQVQVPVADVTITMNSTSKTMKLVNKDTNEEVNVGNVTNNSYNFKTKPGNYTLYAYDDTTLNGTIDLVITDDDVQSYQFFTVTTYATNAGWTLNSDYTIDAQVSSREGKNRTITLGQVKDNSNRATLLVYSGDTYYVKFIPNETRKDEGYMSFRGSGTVTGNTSKTGAIPMGYPYCITVPEGAVAFVGQKGAHFQRFTEIEADNVVTENGVTAYNYRLANNQEYNYRVSQAEKVTYAGIFTMKTSETGREITAAMLEGNPKEIDYVVANNGGMNVADVLMNINEKGHLKLNIGDTHQIVTIRAWQTVNSVTGNYFIEPDYHYTVINETGAVDNSVISVSNDGKIKATGNGTAIVLVTYDAINVASATGGPFFGAIWPENTGVFVVSVGAKETGIATNMTINENYTQTNKVSGTKVDTELDIFYYLESEGGYDYTFTPTGVNSVLLAQPVVGENMTTYNGFSANGVTSNNDGSYTIKLKHGRNIVKLLSKTGAEYQVLTAKAFNYTITNVTSENEKVKPGDKVSIRFNTLYHPTPKLSGVYNMSASIQYKANGSNVNSKGNQYAFASNADAQTISVTIPADWDISNEFELTDGVIKSTAWGDPFGKHREITYETGRNPNFTAVMCTGYFGSLPVITFNMDYEAPTLPTGLVATPDETTIDVSWTTSTDNVSVAKYNIYVNGTFVKSVTETTAVLNGLTPETNYTIEVEAEDAAGNKSAKANTTAKTIDKTAPTTPTELVAVDGDADVTLTWTASTDNVAVVKYNIYVNGTFEKSVTETTCTLTGLTLETEYNVEVEAEDAIGNKSAKANTVAKITDKVAPTAPTELTAIDGDADVTLTWTASTDNVAVVKYNIYVNGTFEKSVTETTCVLTGLTLETEHNVEVEAEDAAGNKSTKANTVAKITDKVAPTIPTELVTVPQNTEITISWIASNDNVGVVKYNIYVNGTFAESVTGTTCTLIELTPGTEHNIEIEAVDAAGNKSTKAQRTCITLSISTGLENITENVTVSVYPNPFVEYIIVNATVEKEMIIYNISGQNILSVELTKGNNKIDTSMLPKGSYILKYGAESIKIIK